MGLLADCQNKWLSPFLTVVVVMGCAPSPQKLLKKVEFPVSGPLKSDVDLHLSGSHKVSGLAFNEEVDAADFFYLSEDVLSLHRAMSDKNQTEWSTRLLNGLMQNRRALVESEYADLIVSRAQTQARKAIGEILPKIKKVPQQLKKVAQATPLKGVSDKPERLEQSLGAIFNYLKAFDAAAGRAGLLPEVYEGVHAQLLKNIKLESVARASIQKLAKATTLKAALIAVSEATDRLDLPMPADRRLQLTKANRLADAISGVTDAKQALVALIEVWNYLKPEDRSVQIASVSPDLYDYLSGLSSEELQCLAQHGCMDIKQWIAKTLVIVPKIEAYGVQKIRQKLDGKGAESVREIVARELAEQGRDLPNIIQEKIAQGVSEKIKPVERLYSQFASEFKNRLKAWSSKSFERQGPSILEPIFNRAQISIDDGSVVKVKWTSRKFLDVEDHAAFSSLATKLWNQSGLDSEKIRALVLSQVNSLAKDYRSIANRLTDAPALKARVYSESLRAYANLALAFDGGAAVRVDKILGEAKAKELFPEFNSEALNQKLFPADAFYALSFNGIAALMGNITSEKSQFFTVNTDKNFVWQGADNPKDGTMEVMAGISDRRRGGHLASTARSEDAARLLLAVCDVNEAAETVENVTSGIMSEPDASGVSPRDQLLKSREKIKILIVGLANYLSHQFRADHGLISHELMLSNQESPQAPIYLLDQALAIRALVRASEEVQNDIYAWEAADILLSMNQHIFNQATGFYAPVGEGRLTPMVLTQTLRALQDVAPHLSLKSRAQLERLQKPWLEKIASWQLSI